MSNVKYIGYRIFQGMNMTRSINIAIDRLLKKDGKSFYWLSKETGISYTTLWRLKKGKALGINFSTLLKLCVALECAPGDLITITHEPAASSRRAISTKQTGSAKRRTESTQ